MMMQWENMIHWEWTSKRLQSNLCALVSKLTKLVIILYELHVLSGRYSADIQRCQPPDQEGWIDLRGQLDVA